MIRFNQINQMVQIISITMWDGQVATPGIMPIEKEDKEHLQSGRIVIDQICSIAYLNTTSR